MRSALSFEYIANPNVSGACIVGDYYIGIPTYGCTGQWYHTGCDIVFQDFHDPYGLRMSNICIVIATNTNLGFQFQQHGGSQAKITPNTYHIIIE